MKHPIIEEEALDIRKSVVSFLKSSCDISRSSNIVFVCGGNSDDHIRARFCEELPKNLPDFIVFQPEYAMGNLINNDMKAPIDLSKFESLISDLSHVIILFPESAGSYAEAGLFSAYSHIRKKTLMVIDEKYQYSDSFISLGPANSFNAHSIFRPNIFIDYDSKAFDGVFDRIKRIGISKKKKKLLLSSFSELEPFEVLGLIQKVVSLLRLATSDDITYIFRAIFGNHLSTRKLNELISISVGAKFLLQKGEYGQYHSSNNLPTLLETREGMKNIENTLRFEISEHIANTDDTFLNPLES